MDSILVEFTDSVSITETSNPAILLDGTDEDSDADDGLGLPVPAPGPNRPKTGPAAARLPIPQTEPNH
jgi:hypothetical protein